VAVADVLTSRRISAGAGISPEPGWLTRGLIALDRPGLIAAVSVVSIVFSEIIAGIVSLAMQGAIPAVVLVAAFVTPGIVAPLASMLLVAVIDHLKREVDDRKRAEDALRMAIEMAEQANRTKSTFLANTSHELRTPLNAVIGFSDMIRDGMGSGVSSDKLIEYATHINDSGRHLLAVLNDILDLSKVEAGKLDLFEEEINLGAIIRSSTALMRERADRGSVILAAEVPTTLPMLWADPRKLRQVLLNLLSNAIKFTAAGGQVTVEAVADSTGAVFISVADTGIGIAAKDIAVALAPFSQVDSALNRKFEGTGLGLPLAKALVELHQGRFELESEPGVGTTVTISFPAARARQRAA